jgi:subtilisin family serine protease
MAAHFDTRKLKFRSRCFGPTSTTVMSVSALSVLALLGCATRRYNSQTASQANVQANDPGEYFAVPGKVRSSDGFMGFLIVTKPALTHPSFVETEKMVAEKLKGWKVRPWGTGRYSHMAYIPVNAAESLDTITNPDETAKMLKDAGGKKLQSVQVIKQDDLSPSGIEKLDAIAPHQSNERIVTADLKESESGSTGTSSTGEFTNLVQNLDTKDPQWSLKFGRVDKAWEFIRAEKNSAGGPGAGVKIGVIDTGFLPEHFEFKRSGAASNVKLSMGMSLIEKAPSNASAIDQFILEGRPANPGHGSAVIGVLTALLPQDPQSQLAFTAGVAPGAEVIPIRASNSTFYKNPKTIAEAVRALTKQKVQVISISLGGLPELALEEALEAARKAGIIVVAAAGNGTQLKVGDHGIGGFAVFPSVWPTVIAAGAGNIECKAWGQSAPAVEVDVLAPGENVWYPASYQDAKGKKIWSLRRGSGTSFATPYVAGAAALWIQAKGGFAELEKQYGKTVGGERDLSGIPKAFEIALKNYGMKLPKKHPDYKTEYASGKYCTGYQEKLAGRTGAGFIDVFNLVKAALPTESDVLKYEPSLSDDGMKVIKGYKGVQRLFFRLFDLNPTAEKLVPANIRQMFGSSPEATRTFVLTTLELKYLGKGKKSAIGQSDEWSKLMAANEEALDLQPSKPCLVDRAVQATKDIAQATKDIAQATKEVPKRPGLLLCELGFLNLAMEYPSFDPRDSSYLLKAFQYLADAKGIELKQLSDSDKREMLDDLLAGMEDWMPSPN